MTQLYTTAAIIGMADAFYLPAWAAIVPELVRREDLRGVNSMNTLAQQSAYIAGPALGVLLAARGGKAMAFSVVTIVYCVAALLIVRLPATARQRAQRAARSFAGSMGEAGRAILSDPRLWITSVTFAICNGIAFASHTVTLPLLIKESPHTDIGYFGLVQALSSVGSLVGALWLARYHSHGRGRLAYAAAGMVGVCMLTAGLPITLPGVAGVWFVRGISITVLTLTWIGMMQQLVARDMLGRVASIDAFLQIILMIVTFVITGSLARVVDATALFVGGGAIALVTAMLAFSHRRIRSFE
jgi:MFS family permease